MNEEERKERFINLLSQLLSDYGGIKIQLAEKLNIKPPTLTRWFQGKVDPATLDLAVFARIAEVSNRSIDDLAYFLGIIQKTEDEILDNFKNFIQDLLSTQSQDSLAKKLGINNTAVAGWVRSQRKVDPRRIAISTVAGLAQEKAWTIERLLIYLGLKEIETENNLFFRLQSGAAILSLKDRVKLLAWLSDLIQQEIIEKPDISIQNQELLIPPSARTFCIILEEEDLAIATNYATNLAVHLQLKPENIQVTTIPKLPESLIDIDVLIFDISSADSANIALIEDLEFNGDIVVFAATDLPQGVVANLSNQVAEVVVKPIDWESLKGKPYFL